jgi:hypothetical protein
LPRTTSLRPLALPEARERRHLSPVKKPPSSSFTIAAVGTCGGLPFPTRFEAVPWFFFLAAVQIG